MGSTADGFCLWFYDVEAFEQVIVALPCLMKEFRVQSVSAFGFAHQLCQGSRFGSSLFSSDAHNPILI